LRLDSTDLCLGLFTVGVSAPISCIMGGGQEMFPFSLHFPTLLSLCWRVWGYKSAGLGWSQGLFALNEFLPGTS
jgi:hypothetical protein